MEKFKAKVRNRVIRLIVVGTSLVAIYLILFFNQDKLPQIPRFIISFHGGVLFGVISLLICHISKNIRAMKDEKSLKELYIKENDERRMMIMQKTGSVGINICILGFGIATIIAGFFNEIIFFTLLGATLFTALVKGFFKVYYFNKI